MEPQVNWTHEETQVLVAVWSEEKIQRGLEESFRNEVVYREVSGRLAAAGMSRSAKQCREKIKKLKLEYRKIKQHCEGSGANIKTFKYYEAMDAVMREKPATTEDTEKLASMISEFIIPDVETESPIATGNSTFISSPPPAPTCCPTEDAQHPGLFSIKLEDVDGPSTSSTVAFSAAHTSARDSVLCCWSKTEVQALLTLWANPAVQRELCLNVRNNKVYSNLSAELALLGFSKAPKKCKEKIKKLKQEYKRIKGGSGRSRTSEWFAIMDEVLSSKAAAARSSEEAESPLLSQPQSDTDDETQWLPDEVQVLVTLWAQPNVQNQLLSTATNSQVFMNLSSELTLVGFNKTPHQCRVKVNNLIKEYRRIKAEEPHGDLRNEWFAILDGVLGPGGETSTEMDSAVTAQPESPDDEHRKNMLWASWTPDEIVVLLTRWAEESVQEQLRSTPKNERVFAQLSSKLATDGFDRTTSQCRSKIKMLKQKYRRIKEQKDSKKQKSRWFVIMDRVFAHHKPKEETAQEAEVMDSASASLQTSQQDLSQTVLDSGCPLSLSSLCLLVPTLRLMCAFAWRVVQCRNVPQYEKVEQLVRLATERAPELLTPREKVQLLLRLRATMVLELCRNESTANPLDIQPHLKVIQNLTMDSACDQEELENSKSDFVEAVHILLEDTEEERKAFFKEVFPIYYGQQYEAILHTLVWKFISRLDYFMPIPDIKQTARWLGDAPSAMEECGRLVLKTEQLKELLHFHQHQTGSANNDLSQAQDMFLPRLSLPHKPNWTHEGPKLNDEQSDDLTAADCSNSATIMSSRSPSPYSNSQGSGFLQDIRKVHLIEEPSQLHSKQPRTISVLQKADTEMYASEMRSTSNCAKVFEDLSALKSHKEKHTLLFHCNKCDKKYAYKTSLNAHRRIHLGEKPYLCSQCGQVFRTASSLDFHVRIHTGDRRYKCPICGKTSIQHLGRHMRMHRGEKNYLCTECGKAFLSSGELRLHMRCHTGERPYTCTHCGKGFIAKCQLTVHMRQHTGETPYKCSVCPKAFQTLKAQKNHVTIHSNKKSFQCLKCGKVFRQEATFEMHVQTHN